MSAAGVDRELPGCARSFVRALWGREVSVRASRPAPNALAPARPTFAASQIWIPMSAPAGAPGAASSYLLAAAAHASAHIEFGAARFLVKALKPPQVALVSLLEDARVERLAQARYPGLARLWAPFHRAEPSGPKTSSALLARLARALHDDAYVDDDGWVNKGRELFSAARADWPEASLSRRIGNVLGHDLGQMRVQFNAKEYVVEPAYRDDHAGLWQFERDSTDSASELLVEGVCRVEHDEPSPWQKRNDSGAPHSADPPHLADEPTPAPRSEPHAGQELSRKYPEWDYVIRRERSDFCSLRERLPPPSDPAHLDAGLARYSTVRRRLDRAARRLALERPVQERRLRVGDRLDLPAAIAAVIAHKSGAWPDPRVYRKARFQRESPAVLVLLDLSDSLNATPAGSATPLLELARLASGLLASTLTRVHGDLAIHGFSSNTRRDVGYYRFKDFEEPYDDQVRARLAGMRASASTRLGTALRHAGRELGAQPARRKILLVVTDGEPSDVDVHDSKYLLWDARQATIRNRQQDLTSFCVGLDAAAEGSVRAIFGLGNYLLLDHLGDLPEKLSQVYLRLAP